MPRSFAVSSLRTGLEAFSCSEYCKVGSLPNKEGNYHIFLIYVRNIVLGSTARATQPIFISKVSHERY